MFYKKRELIPLEDYLRDRKSPGSEESLKGISRISQEKFIELLNSMGIGTPVGIVTLTEPKMRKRGNPYAGNCQKLAKRNGFIGCEYESCARRAEERMGNPRSFRAGPLPWGEREGRYFIRHNGFHYLRFYPKPGTSQVQWRSKDEGQLIDKQEIEGFLPLENSPSPVPWRGIRMDHLLACNVVGGKWILEVREEVK